MLAYLESLTACSIPLQYPIIQLWGGGGGGGLKPGYKLVISGMNSDKLVMNSVRTHISDLQFPLSVATSL